MARCRFREEVDIEGGRGAVQLWELRTGFKSHSSSVRLRDIGQVTPPPVYPSVKWANIDGQGATERDVQCLPW